MFRTIRGFLGKEWRRAHDDFRRLWKNYLYQNFIAVIVLAVVLLALSLQQAVNLVGGGARLFRAAETDILQV